MSKSETVESLVISWLNDLLADYPASSDTPKALPKQFILVERTGGARVAILGDAAEILVEVYNKDFRSDCAEIANYIADHIKDLPATYDDITDASVNSIISLDDTVKQYHRYQIYLDVFHSRVGAEHTPTPTPIPTA